MSGVGKRFADKGYLDLKPLIVVDGKTIINHVVSMFSPQDRFTFICNNEHLRDTNMETELKRIAPGCQILGIAPHKKGPVYAVAQCFEIFEHNPEEEVIVNYCDFYSDWDYAQFLSLTRENNSAGAVAAYRGFHPHMLGTDNYAFIRNNKQFLLEIQEKKPFTDDRMQEFASNGTYYFQSGKLVKKYFSELLESNQSINGEFYVSMVYNLIVEDKLPVTVYEIEHMLQWGTPHDLEEYLEWSNYFRNCAQQKTAQPVNNAKNCVDLIPMAGKGSRFRDVGIKTPKPLLDVDGKPMFVQATLSLPAGSRYIFVVLREAFSPELEKQMNESFANVSVVLLDEISRGQADTCQIGLDNVVPPVEDGAALLIGACDNGMLYDRQAFNTLIANESVDAIAFTFKNNASAIRKPQMYGWVQTESPDSKRATGVSVKRPISETPANDHAIVGAFYFRTKKLFEEGFENLLNKKIMVNGEYYADSLFGELITLGYNCQVFQVQNYICWGTPDDWMTFNYWRKFFDKCNWHEYEIEQI